MKLLNHMKVVQLGMPEQQFASSGRLLVRESVTSGTTFIFSEMFGLSVNRSTPCPNVKHGDEWGEPGNCESGDTCAYCHTRTEQQFHPEIYKSTKCNDVQQAGYCPRGVFCAFAHVDRK